MKAEHHTMNGRSAATRRWTDEKGSGLGVRERQATLSTAVTHAGHEKQWFIHSAMITLSGPLASLVSAHKKCPVMDIHTIA